ncbi:MAG: sigma-70 family RNA polymerase sigma factor [Candidatus Pseudobacter hemicellulosilyticus]|uniref:Sigma-70 family RNA polymerase sigma factor n=1 Tax=Candidatus Pseudobacter hemicellulosilyticus TaxID=3121375 RepID=A0AAJ6BH91_9BACT|nr:MAG: sigma-70 family RNA polymerase sigma factor [Pseudobacter sp.]
MQSLTDQDIITQLRSGNHQVYAWIFEQYWQMLFDIAYRKTGEQADSLDMVQDIFTHLWEKRSQLTVDGPLAPWLVGMVKHKVIDWYRQTSKREVQRLALLSYLEQQTGTATTEPLIPFEKTYAHLQQAVDQLPDRMREIYRLHQDERLSVAAIADKLSLQPQSVKNALHKASLLLRKAMEPHLDAAISGLTCSAIWISILFDNN